jgi:hypothetical protein
MYHFSISYINILVPERHEVSQPTTSCSQASSFAIMDSFDAPERWTEFGVGVFIIFLRCFAKYHAGGWRNFGCDDFCCLVCLVSIVPWVYYAKEDSHSWVNISYFFLRFTHQLKLVHHPFQNDLEIFLIYIFEVLRSGTTQGMTPESAAAMDAETARKVELGSKFYIISWCSYIGILWSLKFALLIYYHRLA